MSWYLLALRNYARFEARARRLEFWAFTVVNAVAGLTLQMLDGLAHGRADYLYAVYAALVFLPSLAVAVRRLHDTGRSGWWMLVALVPVVGAIVVLVLMVTGGDAGPNGYGPRPLRHPVHA
jgi:uncharacterized membrane protein YhaH (DUF805 family)